MAGISRMIRRQAQKQPGRTAIGYAGESTSYGELWRRIGLLAGMLRRRGVEPGQRVALLMKNSQAFVELAFAVSHVGAVLVPINFRLSPDEIDYILRDSGAVLLLRDMELATWPAAAPRTVELDAAAQANAALLAAEGADGGADAGADGGMGDDAMAPLRDDDLMRIMYTSGTTDRPKGVMHSYRNFYAKTADQMAELALTADTRLLACGPLYHVGAFDLPGIGVLWAGGAIVIQREFDADAALGLISDQRLTGAWLAPVMAGALIEAQQRGPRDAASLQWVIGGGERTPETRIRAFAQAFPAARYIDAYGLTETCGGDTMMEPGREIDRIGSVGRPLSLVDVAIRDDAGDPAPQGAEGEVCIRGAKVTQGYWNAPDKTAASFFGEWLRTGDVGYLDAEGFLYLTDRKKDLIISGGENIASSEVERVIQELAGVADAAVVAVPDARWGERPVAHVVLHEGAQLGEADIRAHCRERLAAFKAPDRVFFHAALPRSASGKVLKRELRLLSPGDEA